MSGDIPDFLYDSGASEAGPVEKGGRVLFPRVARSPSITHGYIPRIPELDHQTVGLEKLSPLAAGAYLMDFGTGKSFTSITNIGELESGQEIDGAFILSPKGDYDDWTLSNPETSHWAICANPSLLHRLRLVQWQGGHRKSEKEALRALLNPYPGEFPVLVMNTEALSSSKRAEDIATEFLKSRRCMIVNNESTTCKSPSAARAKAAVRLAALAPYRRILTGFPTPKSSLDLFMQFAFLDKRILGHRSFFTFRQRYAVLKKVYLANRSVDVVEGFQNTEELWGLIDPVSFRVRADDCLDLPERTYHRQVVEMTDEQRRIYADMRDQCLSQVGGAWTSATVAVAQITKLHQIACGFVTTEDGTEVEIPNRRVDALIDKIDEIGEPKIVIWATYHHCLRQIVSRLEREYGPRSFVQYHGGIGDSDRAVARDRFSKDPDCRFFVGTQATGGRGLNDLIVARSTIYYANNYNLELRLNSEARTRRKGSERHSSVTYTDLITEGTVEEKIVQSLRRNIDVASAVLNDGYRQWLI
jgi:SNF2 family DNA or RNA helicase